MLRRLAFRAVPLVPRVRTSRRHARSSLRGRRVPALTALLVWLVLGAGATSAEAGELVQATREVTDRFADEPLAPASETQQFRADARSQGGASGPSGGRVVLSLGAVAVLIVGLGWIGRRVFAAQQQRSGGTGVTLVARTLLTPKHQVLVLRAGHRLLIVGDSGHGMNLLCQVSDPAEMAAILGEAGGGSEDARLRGEAFAATLGEASEGYERGDASARRPYAATPRARPATDGDAVDEETSLDVAQSDVRSLIARVRGLAGQMNAPASHAGARELLGRRGD